MVTLFIMSAVSPERLERRASGYGDSNLIERYRTLHPAARMCRTGHPDITDFMFKVPAIRR